MKLPLLTRSASTTPADLSRRFEKISQEWSQSLADPTPFEWGIAYANPRLPLVHPANYIREAHVPDQMSAAAVIAESEAHFQALRCRCLDYRLKSNELESSRALEQALLARRWQRQLSQTLYLQGFPAQLPAPRDIQIVPARAVFAHAQELARRQHEKDSSPAAEQWALASLQRLDDPHWDKLIALEAGTAIGKVGVYCSGDVGRISSMFVLPEARRRGVAQTLLWRALELCARAQLRHVFLECDSDNAAALALYAKFGFVSLATVTALAPPVE